MTDLVDFFLTGLASYGTPLFAAALFLGASGLPVPASLLVVAAGAFSRQGVLDPFPTAIAGLFGALAGDSVSFALGRLGGAAINRRFGAAPGWGKARAIFERNSLQAVFLTRFLVTPAAFPVNLMAGVGCPYVRFLSVILVGQSIWILSYGGLGYLFGSEWELISGFLSDLGGFALGLAAVIVALVALRRLTRSARKRKIEGSAMMETSNPETPTERGDAVAVSVAAERPDENPS